MHRDDRVDVVRVPGLVVALDRRFELGCRVQLGSHGQKPSCFSRDGSATRLEKIDDFRQELRDRFGPLPEPAEWLMRLAELRLLAARWQVATVHLEKPHELADQLLEFLRA